MMPLLFALVVLSFIAYHITFFSYCAYIFNTNKKPIFAGIVCGTINIIIWFTYIFYIPIHHEPLILILYLLALAIETKIVFKSSFIQMVFIAVTFTINLFAKRIAILATIAILNHGTIVEIVSNTHFAALTAIISFIISISTISFARNTISRNSLDTILADNKNLAFLATAFSLLFCNLFVFLLTISIDIGSNDLLYHYALLGFVTISAFAVFIVFAHNLAELRMTTETFKRLSRKNSEDLQKLKDLEQEAIKDTLTGLYTRDYAERRAQELTGTESSVFVAFIDLDGLKTVNDNYGHEEGDFYIKSVADILMDYFHEDCVCRYGGDEMLVIGQYKTEDEITKKLVWCYNAVLKIPTLNKKEYATSISYGAAFKHSYETITAANLIAIADSRMYELKKNHKKHRKVISVRK